MIQSKYSHRPNYSYSYRPGPGTNHQYSKCFIGLLASAMSDMQREHHFRKLINIFIGFTNILNLLQDQQRYEGAGPTTRLHIDLVQTLRRPHIAFVRPRAELTETAIAVNHSINNSVKH